MKEGNYEASLEAFFNYKLSSVYTAINCEVIAVRTELNDQRVDVLPLPKAVKPDGESKDRPVITNVPLMFPSSAKAALTFPIDVGDTVLCVFSQRSLDQFKASATNGTYAPKDKRKFSMRDAIAIPGLFAFDKAINNPSKHKWPHSTRDLVIVNNLGSDIENEVRLKSNGDISVKTDQDFYATFNDGLIECNNLTVNAQGNINVFAGVNLNMESGGNTSLTVGSNYNVDVTGTTTVNAPTTNWTGIFNLNGTLGMTGGGGGGSGTATIDAPLIVNDTITLNSSMTASGDVTAAGVSVSGHTHTGDSGGTTSPPN